MMKGGDYLFERQLDRLYEDLPDKISSAFFHFFESMRESKMNIREFLELTRFIRDDEQICDKYLNQLDKWKSDSFVIYKENSKLLRGSLLFLFTNTVGLHYRKISEDFLEYLIDLIACIYVAYPASIEDDKFIKYPDIVNKPNIGHLLYEISSKKVDRLSRSGFKGIFEEIERLTPHIKDKIDFYKIEKILDLRNTIVHRVGIAEEVLRVFIEEVRISDKRDRQRHDAASDFLIDHKIIWDYSKSIDYETMKLFPKIIRDKEYFKGHWKEIK